MAASRRTRSRRSRASRPRSAPDVKVSFAADDNDGAAVAAAKASDVAIVVVGNDPTCGPNMAHDWNDNGTKPCADPGDGREGRDRETIKLAQEELVKKVLAANPRTVMVLVSSFPFAINWSQAQRARDPAHDARLAGRRHRARGRDLRRLQSRRACWWRPGPRRWISFRR